MRRVQYIDVGNALVVGQTASVIPYDHPIDVLNRTWVRTTLVQQITDSRTGPVFRTRNTIYRPMDGIEPLAVGHVQFLDYTKIQRAMHKQVHV